MQNSLVKKIADIVKAEKRFFFVILILILFFFVNQALYAGQKKTIESCVQGKCLGVPTEKPQLTKEKGYYYANDFLKNKPAGYYRLTFQEKADQAEKIFLKLSTQSEEEKQISTLALEPSEEFRLQEIVFFLPEGFDSLLLQKEDLASAGNVFVNSFDITKLDVTELSELNVAKKTILGETKLVATDNYQPASEYVFSELKESKTSLGQVFQARNEIISAVALGIDISRNINPGSRQYALSLREIEYDGKNVANPGPIIANIAFSPESIEKYRQIDGTFLFPLFGKLEKGKYYFLGVDNAKVEVNNQNYLELRGSADSDSYPDGLAVVKKGKLFHSLSGDLYFKIYDAKLSSENGVKILAGAKIEDLGRGVGKYSYATKGKFIDLFDLENASPGTGFSDSYGVIYALAKGSASFSYAVQTIYPINRMNFSATQVKVGWKKVKVSYSLDEKNWIDLKSSEKLEIANSNLFDDPEENQSLDDASGDNLAFAEKLSESGENAKEFVQMFDAKIIPAKEANVIYFKITYDPDDASKGKFFALKNLKIDAELKIK